MVMMWRRNFFATSLISSSERGFAIEARFEEVASALIFGAEAKGFTLLAPRFFEGNLYLHALSGHYTVAFIACLEISLT